MSEVKHILFYQVSTGKTEIFEYACVVYESCATLSLDSYLIL